MFGNLLNQALTLIPKQQFIYRKFNSYQINEYGVKVSIYDTDIEFEGSVQAIDSKMYQELGLDFSKKYINIFSSLNIKNVSREQNSPDNRRGGCRYQFPGVHGFPCAPPRWISQKGYERGSCLPIRNPRWRDRCEEHEAEASLG